MNSCHQLQRHALVSSVLRTPAHWRFALLVPTLNAGTSWRGWIQSIQAQTIQPTLVLVLDSESHDDTVLLAKQAGFSVHTIARHSFAHGATRQQGLNLVADSVDFLVCMTQDAELASPYALEHLMMSFADSNVGAAFGRQLPAANATPVARHARTFNYPDASSTTSFQDVPVLGIKTCFLSNSFAAYRTCDLLQVGGFPPQVILGEDTSVAAKLLMAGRHIRYQADACVYHSHNYTPWEEFRRYFDTGVFHARSPWLLANFGGAGGEGMRFVISELQNLIRKAPLQIPSAVLRTFLKLLGYRLGRIERWLPLTLKHRLSMFRNFWAHEANRVDNPQAGR